MRATAQIKPQDDTDMTITLRMTLHEARALLDAVKDGRWPSGALSSILRQSLDKATSAYDSAHEFEP